MEEEFILTPSGDPRRKAIVLVLHKKHMNAMSLTENAKDKLRILGVLIQSISSLMPHSPEGTVEREVIRETCIVLDDEIYRLRIKLKEAEKKYMRKIDYL
jgi:hypothetical protein